MIRLLLIYQINNLSVIPDLSRFTKIKQLDCSHNYLTILPPLNDNLTTLQSLPRFNETLERLYCYYNRLTFLPPLNNNLEILNCYHNSFDVFNCNDAIDIMRCKINILTNFRHVYYCLQFKNQSRKWLWERVREPKIVLKYHPSYLADHLIDE